MRAKVVGDAPIEAVEARVGDGEWAPMMPMPGAMACWQALASQGARVTVRVRDAHGRTDEDQVEPAGPGWTPPSRRANGGDRHRIGAWPEKGILDTQLGPNRNGRKW